MKLIKVGTARRLSWCGLIGLSFCVAPAFAEERIETESSESDETDHAESRGDSHAAGHGHHVPHFSDINWFTGLIGEKEGVEPGLLWRPVGMPVPLGALLINTAILFFFLGRFGGPAISSGLKARKEQISSEIDRAAAMKNEAESQLAHYEGKLAEMAAEMDRIKQDLREQAHLERKRVLSEANERAESLRTEAGKMIEQQLDQARQEAIERAVVVAVTKARIELAKSLASTDQDRLAQDLFSSLDTYFEGREARS